jgi:hypothetical protein
MNCWSISRHSAALSKELTSLRTGSINSNA